MRTNSTHSATLSRSAVLLASLCAGCALDAGAAADEELAELEETAQESGTSTTSVTSMPSFGGTPNIAAAASALVNPSVVAVARTISGLQIYRCELGTAGPEWKLRTPLAGLQPSPDVQRISLNFARLGAAVATYHYRSDFGALLGPNRIESLGLTAATAPVWDLTFRASGGALRREIVAGRVMAQDATSPDNIPLLLIGVRGRSIDPGTPTALASATHMLRWNTRGGLAPAAASCTTAAIGQEVQSPYAADYYFITAGN